MIELDIIKMYVCIYIYYLISNNAKKSCLESIETRDKSSLCLLLNIESFCGISKREGGPNGVHTANSANGGSSVF